MDFPEQLWFVVIPLNLTINIIFKIYSNLIEMSKWEGFSSMWLAGALLYKKHSLIEHIISETHPQLLHAI